MTKFEIFNNINTKNIIYPIMMSGNLKQLLKGLLDKDPKKRFNWNEVNTSQWTSDVFIQLFNLTITNLIIILG